MKLRKAVRKSVNRSARASLEPLEGRLLLTTYYVSLAGNTAGTGTMTKPWNSVAKVISAHLVPGDTVLFRGGDFFNGTTLYFNGLAGTSSSPITFGSYGTGRATIGAGGTNGTGAGAYFWNCSGISVSNLNFKGSGASSSVSGGIFFYNDRADNAHLSYIRVDQTDISGYEYGVEIGGGATSAGFDDVRVTNSKLHDNQRAGVFTFAAQRNVHKNLYFGHIEAYNNLGVDYTTLPVGTVTGHGIILGQVNGATVERCVAHDNGALGDGGAGIWAYDSNAVIFQYNEAYRNHTAYLHDGDGFDLDRDTSNSIMQYNYSHDNDGGGYLLSQRLNDAVHTGNIVRYNISANDGRRNTYGAIHLWGRINSAEIYNNTIYMNTVAGTHAAVRIHNNGLGSTQAVNKVHFRNNIFMTSGGQTMIEVTPNQVTYGVDLKFQGNDYWSSGSSFKILWNNTTYTSLSAWRTATSQEKNGTTSTGYQVDPLLTGVTTPPTIGNADNLSTLSNYKISGSSSPMVNKGLNLSSTFGTNVGSRDFWGDAIPQQGAYDIGADESPYSSSQPPPPPPGFNAHINFQPSGSALYSGYTPDYGQTYASRNGLTYGWNADCSSTMRDRNASNSADQRYDTLVQMQLNGTFTWEIAVPNGTYQVHIAAGDPSYYGNAIKLNAENVLAVDGTTSSMTRWIEGTVTVTVSDGRLTISNGAGSSNNKMNYIDIQQQVTSSGAAVTASAVSPSPATASLLGTSSLIGVDKDPLSGVIA
jgi:hypothetical protein